MLLVFGQVLRPHGVHGEVVVDVRTDSPAERFVAGSVVQTDPAAAGPLTMVSVRPHQGKMLVTFEGFTDRTVAETLRGVQLCVDSDSMPPPEDPDEFHDHQLMGLRAESPAGELIGEVVKIDHVPAADLLVIRLADGRTGLVPFVAAIVPEVDIAGGRVVLTPPNGLFDL
jgi:16S rRNA processing protein RimM